MKIDDIYFFKQLLNEQLDTLLGQADTVVHDLIEKEYETSPDPLDRASFELERGTMLRIRDRESKLIRKIQKSLENLENGSFGICEMCEKEIAIARLKARPVTTYCITCKTKMEALER
ncbi:MAG: RNA polymerase-binding protein DksA [Deltaproteobacteria bacterium]|jgi:DnaK suppressor protein|nr:RNA polymerase-binding protein DksA [Deltaproteobacteria bacterium]